MDKWKLLRSALQGKRESDSAASIHRNDGIFAVIEKQCTAWEWTLDFTIAGDADFSLDELRRECHAFMLARDIVELSLRLTCCGGLPECVLAAECCRLKHDDTSCGGGGGGSPVELYWQDANIMPFMPNAKYHRWTLPSGEVLHTREKAKDAGIGVTQLLSHKLYGVDNTGNVKVWAAESMLLHVLLNNYRSEFENRSILELGGGLTALCGIGMAAAVRNALHDPDLIPSCTVVATDGHPECVANQKVCIHMNQQYRNTPSTNTVSSSSNDIVGEVTEGLPSLSISSHLLRWSKDDPHQELASILKQNQLCTPEQQEDRSEGKFSRIIAADCLFFRDFHTDLVWLLQAALAPGGIIFLLQPRRGGTMDEFIAKAEAVFSIAIVTEYDTQITALHQRYLNESDGDKTIYDPDIHYPVLLMLTHRAEAVVTLKVHEETNAQTV